MSKRKFEVKVSRTMKYEVDIDDEKLEDGLIEDFEMDFYKLNKDKIKDLAHYIATQIVDRNSYFIEGVGSVEIDGLCFYNGEKETPVSGIKVTNLEYEDEDFSEVEEID